MQAIAQAVVEAAGAVEWAMAAVRTNNNDRMQLQYPR